MPYQTTDLVDFSASKEFDKMEAAFHFILNNKIDNKIDLVGAELGRRYSTVPAESDED